MDFMVKLLKSIELGSTRIYNSILIIVYQLTKAAKFRPTEESIIAKELIYKVE